MAKVSIPKMEYLRLKSLDRRVGRFFDYLDYLKGIRGARQEVKEGRTISQERLFRQLGF